MHLSARDELFREITGQAVDSGNHSDRIIIGRGIGIDDFGMELFLDPFFGIQGQTGVQLDKVRAVRHDRVVGPSSSPGSGVPRGHSVQPPADVVDPGIIVFACRIQDLTLEPVHRRPAEAQLPELFLLVLGGDVVQEQ